MVPAENGENKQQINQWRDGGLAGFFQTGGGNGGNGGDLGQDGQDGQSITNECHKKKLAAQNRRCYTRHVIHNLG